MTFNEGDRVTWDGHSFPGLGWTEGVVLSVSPFGIRVEFGPDKTRLFIPINKLDTLKKMEEPKSD